jgi:hypothetical protein
LPVGRSYRSTERKAPEIRRTPALSRGEAL